MMKRSARSMIVIGGANRPPPSAAAAAPALAAQPPVRPPVRPPIQPSFRLPAPAAPRAGSGKSAAISGETEANGATPATRTEETRPEAGEQQSKSRVFIRVPFLKRVRVHRKCLPAEHRQNRQSRKHRQRRQHRQRRLSRPTLNARHASPLPISQPDITQPRWRDDARDSNRVPEPQSGGLPPPSGEFCIPSHRQRRNNPARQHSKPHRGSLPAWRVMPAWQPDATARAHQPRTQPPPAPRTGIAPRMLARRPAEGPRMTPAPRGTRLARFLPRTPGPP